MTIAQAQDPSFALAHWFGLTRTQGRVLARLYQADGEVVTFEEVGELLRSPLMGAVSQTVSVIRASLDVEGLDRVQGQGYRLTEIGLDECSAALKTLAAELLQAA
jgi:hypothetical protein